MNSSLWLAAWCPDRPLILFSVGDQVWFAGLGLAHARRHFAVHLTGPPVLVLLNDTVLAALEVGGLDMDAGWLSLRGTTGMIRMISVIRWCRPKGLSPSAPSHRSQT